MKLSAGTGRIPFSLKILLPANSDRLAYDLGLIDTDLAYAQIRDRYKTNSLSTKHEGTSDYLARIRERRWLLQGLIYSFAMIES